VHPAPGNDHGYQAEKINDHGFGEMILPSLSFIVLSGRPFLGVFVGDFSPSSTRRRMASERDGASFLPDHACISSISEGGSRMPTKGSRPVAGLPRLGFTGIDFMNWVLQ
jgi:hypothetical protein